MLTKILGWVSLISFASSLNAGVVYTRAQNVEISSSSYVGGSWLAPSESVTTEFAIDIDGGGVKDLKLFYSVGPIGPVIVSAPINGAVVAGIMFTYAGNFARGDVIGADFPHKYGDWNGRNSSMVLTSSAWRGRFYETEGFLGLRIPTTNGFQYGWVGLAGGLGGDTLAVSGWAYETEVGRGIAAGDQGVPAKVPDNSSSLVILGLCAVGIAYLKRHY